MPEGDIVEIRELGYWRNKTSLIRIKTEYLYDCITDFQLDMDPEFLMEIMEVNEELADAESEDTVRAIGQRNQQILDGLLR